MNYRLTCVFWFAATVAVTNTKMITWHFIISELLTLGNPNATLSPKLNDMYKLIIMSGAPNGHVLTWGIVRLTGHLMILERRRRKRGGACESQWGERYGWKTRPRSLDTINKLKFTFMVKSCQWPQGQQVLNAMRLSHDLRFLSLSYFKTKFAMSIDATLTSHRWLDTWNEQCNGKYIAVP